MWLVAVAAAVAGSGIIAKHIFSPNSHNPTSKTNQTEHNNDELLQLPRISNLISNDCIDDTRLSFPQNRSNSSSFLNHCESENSNLSATVEENVGVFLFSSSGSGSKPKKSRNLGKKMCKKVGLVDNGSVNQRKGLGRKVSLRLKRRKTSKNSDVKCDSSLTKDCSSFGWGLGLGMMYMMSAGKDDISKLSNTIDETAKAVHELKSQLNKHKFVPCQQVLNSNDTRDTVDTLKIEAKQANVESSPLRHDTSISHLADSDYPSSVLTEEQQHDGAEMDQLEAELESELQKLPWCAFEASENIDKSNHAQIKRHELVHQNSTVCQSDGVPPSELQKKLSALVIEQQEDQISELESELNLAYSKLKEKEAELQAMKDCVRRLTEFSLSNVSDEDTEACKEQCSILDHQNNVVAENTTVGTKRTMHFRTCNS